MKKPKKIQTKALPYQRIIHLGRGTYLDLALVRNIKVWDNYPRLDKIVVTFKDGTQSDLYGYGTYVRREIDSYRNDLKEAVERIIENII